MQPQILQEPTHRLTFLDLKADVDEDLLWELCTQFGVVLDVVLLPVVSATTTTDEAPQKSGGGPSSTLGGNNNAPLQKGLVTFETSEDARYCYEAIHRSRVKLFGKELRILHEFPERHPTSQGGAASTSGGGGFLADGAKRRRAVDLYEIGAKVFVRGLNTNVTIADIAQVFGSFGPFAIPPQLQYDRNGVFKGTCLLSYTDFQNSDAVIAEMNHKVVFDRIILCEYALREDGEKHGSEKERAHAALFRQQEASYQQRVQEQVAAHRQRSADVYAANTDWAANLNPYDRF